MSHMNRYRAEKRTSVMSGWFFRLNLAIAVVGVFRLLW